MLLIATFMPLALLLADAESTIPADARPFASFWKGGPGYIEVRVEIGTLPPANSRERGGYWFRRKRGSHTIAEASTRTCPQAWAAVDRMETIATPWIDVPSSGRPSGLSSFDSLTYVLEASALYPDRGAGQIRIEGSSGSLAAWIDSTVETLEPCWHPPETPSDRNPD